MKEFKVIIAGGRDFTDFSMMCKIMDNLLSAKKIDHKIVIVSGNARGADLLGEKYASLRKYSIAEYPAQWDLHGRSAGYRRNEEMSRQSDAAVVFWDGMSRGSEHMVNISKASGKPYKVVEYNMAIPA
jgi:hypothetical protein